MANKSIFLNTHKQCHVGNDARGWFHASFLGFAYVASLYILVPRNVRALPRTDTSQIKSRMRAICLMTSFSVMVYFPLTFCSLEPQHFPLAPQDARPQQGDSTRTVTEIMSLQITPLLGSSVPLLHTMVLFLGPLSIIIIKSRLLVAAGNRRRMADAFYKVLVEEYGLPPTLGTSSWTSDQLRDLIVGPVTEELCFRALIVPYLLSAGVRPLHCVFTAPLLFGFAHVHHGINRVRDGYPLSATIINTFFQFSYTYLFGAYATYALLKTNDVSSAIACHSFCNFMGLPTFPSAREREVYVHRRWVYAAYACGLMGFVCGFKLYGGVSKPAGALGYCREVHQGYEQGGD